MKTQISLILTGFLVFCSCEKDQNNNYYESLSTVISADAPDTVKNDNEFTIEIVHSGSSGCSTFSRYEIDNGVDTTFITMYQKRNKDDICTAVIIDIETSITISLHNSGIRYLAFKQYNEELLVDSVNVVE